MEDNLKNPDSSNAFPWGEKMLNLLKKALDRYLKKYPRYDELITFMSDEQQMYNEDGKPSEKYLELINDFNDHCAGHPLDIKEMANNDNLNSNMLEALEGAEDFIIKQRELMKSYRESSDKDKWVNQVLDTPEKRETFDKIIDTGVNNALKEFETEK